MTAPYFKNPKIVICEWFPMGTNNIIALNRHVGAHKQYKAPTAFGMKGEIKDLSKGTFKTLDGGCFLQTVDFSFSEYLKASFKPEIDDKCAKGVDIDKDGACYIGAEFSKNIGIARSKHIIGKSASEFVARFLPILTDTQSSLLKCSYGVNSDDKLLESISSYALIITDDIGIKIDTSEEFMQSETNRNILAPVTDWIIDHYSIGGCHIFTGMKAMVCVGTPNPEIKQYLKTLLFQNTLFNISLKLHSTMWNSMKSLTSMGKNIPTGNYKMLKLFNEELATAQGVFSKQKIVCNQIKNSISSKQQAFIENANKKHPLYNKIIKAYNEELEKSNDREILSEQMSIDIQGLRDQLQQRMSLIITKNGQRLNLILLILTLISVMGIGEILGFSHEQIAVVALILTPFIYFAIKSFLQYKKDFD